MKFIKTADGWYIDLEKVTEFRVLARKDYHFDAVAYIADDRTPLATFDTREQAHAYLGKLVADLNAEDKKCGD